MRPTTHRTFLLLGAPLLLIISASVAGIGAAAPTTAASPHGLVPSGPKATAPSALGTALPPAPAVGHGTGLNVNPTGSYSAEPAPMGIADFGISGSSAYSYSTSEWLGNYSWSQNCASGCNGGTFTVQLNVVLSFVQGGTTYSFWIQDVAQPTTATGSSLKMEMLDNVWNFSSSSLAKSGITGNGTTTTDGSDYYYYDVASGTGSGATLTAPGHFYLEVRTFMSGGVPVVDYLYNDGFGWIGFDQVHWTWATHVTNFQEFYVDGSAYNAGGWFDDAELDFTGAAGGTTDTLDATSNAHTELEYWNGHNFQAVPSAWNFGGDTGEKMTSAMSIWSQDGSGAPETTQLNGTTRDAKPGQAYLTTQVGTLVVWVPSLSTGTVGVGADGLPYTGGWVEQTLVPGTYPVWANGTGVASTYLGQCVITAGSLLNVSLASPCSGSNNPAVSVPTAAPTSVDVGQPVTFTSSLTAPGAGGDTYSWAEAPATGLGCAASTSLTLTCTPTTSNVYTIWINVTDSSLHTGSASLTAFKVYATPTVAVPTASPSSGTTGSTVTFTSSAGRLGSGADTYAWTESPASGLGCSASTTVILSCTPTAAGTYTATITVTDSNGGTGSNASASFTVVVGNPAVTNPTASAASDDVGHSVTFTSSLSSPGAGSPTYAWTTSPSSGLGCAASTSLTVTCSPTNSNVYTITLTVTDSAGHSGSASLTGYVVHPDPTVAVPVAAPASVTVGGTLTITSSLGLSGSGGDTYSWTYSPSSGLGCAASTTTSVSCTTATAGTYKATLTVKDSNGGTGSNVSATITVNSLQPTVSTPTASPRTVDVGTSVSFTSTLTSPGAGGDVYVWSATPSGLGCAASSTLTFSCSPTLAGTYSITITVTDSASNKGTATLTGFTVSAGPAVGTPTASPTEIDVGQSVSFTLPISQTGATPDTFSWATSSGLGCPSGTGSTLSCTPSAAGTFTVSATMTDANGQTATGTLAFTVNAAPAVSDPTPNPTTAAVGVSVTWTSTLTSPGTPADSYTWSETPASGLGCSSSTGLTLTCVPTAVGSYTVSITVTDMAGLSKTANSAAFTVSAPATLVASDNANVTSGTAPLSVSFTGSAVGGVPGYTYTWRFGDGNAAVGQAVPHTFTQAGSYTVWLWVNDSDSHSATAKVTVNVTASNSGTSSSTSAAGVLGSYWWLLLLIAIVAVAAVVGVAYARRRKPEEQFAPEMYPPSPPPMMMAAGAPPTGYASVAPPVGPGAPYNSDGYNSDGFQYDESAVGAPPGPPPA